MAIGTLATLPQKFGTALSLYGGGGGATERYAPNFNGVSQYGLFPSPIIYGGDFEISIKVMIPQSIPVSNSAFFGGSGGGGGKDFTVFINSSVQSISAQINTLSGNRYDLAADINPYLGSTIQLKVTRYSGVWNLIIDNSVVDVYDSNPQGVTDQEVEIVARWGSGLYFQGVAYDYKDSLGNNYPMDDGWANNPTMRNTGSGADGTFINMTEAAWLKING